MSLLRLHVVRATAHDLSLRRCERPAGGLGPYQSAHRSVTVLSEASLVSVQGQDPRPHVPGLQERPENRREPAHAAFRLWRLSNQSDAVVPCGRRNLRRAWRCLRAAESSRRRRVRRKWHRAGMLANKQNVFDDFTSAAEWLIENGYTKPANLALTGGSNGGLWCGHDPAARPVSGGGMRVPTAGHDSLSRLPAGQSLGPRIWICGRRQTV